MAPQCSVVSMSGYWHALWVMKRPPVYEPMLSVLKPAPLEGCDNVVKVKAIDAEVVVLARDYWTARKIADLVKVTWDNRHLDRLSTTSFVSEYRELINNQAWLQKISVKCQASIGRAHIPTRRLRDAVPSARLWSR